MMIVRSLADKRGGLSHDFRDVAAQRQPCVAQFVKTEPSRFKSIIARGRLARNPFAKNRDQYEMQTEPALGGVVENTCKPWTEEPDWFRLNPIHHMPGLNT